MNIEKSGRALPGHPTNDPSSLVAPRSDTSNDTLLTRAEAARILEVSVSTLRRLERSALPPVVDENGVHLQSEERVLEYKLQRNRTTGSSRGLDGTLAAAAFEHFDRGSGAADVVKVLRLDPALARELLREWADLRGGFFVGATAASQLQRFAWSCDDPDLKTGDDLVRLLAEMEKASCACCKRRTPRLCVQCYATRPRAAQKFVAARIAASEVRQNERDAAEIEREAIERARERGGVSSDRWVDAQVDPWSRELGSSS